MYLQSDLGWLNDYQQIDIIIYDKQSLMNLLLHSILSQSVSYTYQSISIIITHFSMLFMFQFLLSKLIQTDYQRVYLQLKAYYQEMNQQETTKSFKYLEKLNYFSLENLEGAFEDSQTIQAYITAIRQNPHLFINKSVLHITSGCNCLYSIVAAEMGAKNVHCVINGHDYKDQQSVFMMKEIIKSHAQKLGNRNLMDIIQVKFYKDFNSKVDVILGEPMGYCLHFDSLLDRMVETKDLYLNKGGIIFPSKINFKCCLINDEHYKDKKFNYWDEVYGIKMSCMKRWISQEPIVRVVDPTLIVSNIAKFMSYDIKNTNYQDLQSFTSNFQLTLNDPTSQYKPNGLCIWFEVQFPTSNQKLNIKASPFNQPTRWTQVSLYANQQWNIKDKTSIKIRGRKNYKDNNAVINLMINKSEEIYYYS